MTSFIDQYYNINRKFLIIMGLWPYQKWRSRIFQNTFFSFVLISSLISQLTTFITSEFNLAIVLKVLSLAIPCLIYFLMYVTFLLNKNNVKILFERICCEWMILKATDEIDILRKYAKRSKQFTLLVIVLIIFGLNSLALIQLLPNFLDIIMPLNESRQYNLLVSTEYFVDQNRYFYPIYIHIQLSIYIGCSALCSTGCMLMSFILHNCAMLKIASYRFQHVSDNVPSKFESQKDNVFRKRIISAVDMHRRALEFAEYMMSSFINLYIILFGVAILSLTVNLFQFLQFIIFLKDLHGSLVYFILVVGHFVCMFIANLAGQTITDHNSNILNVLYSAQWYTISLQAQKLLLFIMQKNTKNYYFVIGGFFIVSLEGFSSMASMSVSYFTVIYSIR